MSINRDPIFGNAPLFAAVVAVTANLLLDGTGTVSTILTAGANGSFVNSLKALCRATVTPTACRLFISIDAGATKNLIDEKLMGAYTVAATTAQTPVIFVDKTVPSQAIKMPALAILYGSIAVALAGGIVFEAEYQDLAAG